MNFCLLGLLVEEWTGRPYTDVVQEQLLTPLGIDGMRFAATFDTADDTAVEHRSGPGRNYMEVLGAAGSWIASPTEIASILNSLDHETPGWKALTPATFESMRTITVDPPPPPAPPSTDPAATAPTTTVFRGPPLSGYGMGLMVFAPGSFGHTGTLESTTAMVVRRPDGITWAVTVSGEYPRSGRDLAPIVNEALGKTGLL